MDNTKMLGQMSISKLLLKFAVPCVTGLLIGALYNIVDQIFIGNSSLGYLGNAATGISFPVLCIANAFAWCVGDGAASYLSICAGRNDSESAHKCVGTGLSTTALISILLSVICLIFCEPLMRVFGASPATLELACDYFRIIALFFPPYLMFNVMNSMIRADGNPGYAMIALLSGAVLNIILDPICIFVLDWGIKGAAIATVTGQVVSFIISLLYFRHPRSFRLTKHSFIINPKMLRNLISLGGSTFIIQISMVIMTMLSNVMLFKYGALSIFGSDIALSVYSIQTKVYTIVNNIAVGIALGGQPVLGYNYGAKQMDRVKETYRLIVISSLSIGVVSSLIFIFCPQVVISLFGRQNSVYMDFATISFRISLGLCFITCFIKISSIFFQAIGKAVHAMIASVIRDMFCFVTLTIVLCRLFESLKPGTGIFGILIAAPLSDFIAGLIILFLTAKFFRTEGSATDRTIADVNISGSHPGTIITIARQHGTCGKQIGKLVAEELGIPFYCKELTALVAKDSGLAEEFLSDDDENVNENYRHLYLSTEVGQKSLIAQEKVLRQIADQGSCVIVGRAADYILRDYPDLVRIFIYGPTAERIKNIQEMYGDNAENAQIHMHQSDKRRASYYRAVTGEDWNNPENYDLCISCDIGKKDTAEIITAYIQKHS